MTPEPNYKDICCPEFHPDSWDEKICEWKNKKFVKDSVFTLFYMPVNFGTVIRRMNKKAEKVKAGIPDWMCLSDHTSKWNMDLYLAVDKEIPDAENTTISGTFATKVYEGPYKDTGKWAKDFNTWCRQKGYNPDKYYMWYTTCPKCAKKYGKNYVVFVGQIEKT